MEDQNSDLAFREIHHDELDQLLSLYEYLHTKDLPLPHKGQVQKVWLNICNNSELIYLGAFKDNQLISTCNLSIIQNMTRGCKPYGLIENVCTHPKNRRLGIGQRLMQYTLNLAWKQDCYKVMLLTGTSNAEAHKFYKASGFDSDAKHGFIAMPHRE